MPGSIEITPSGLTQSIYVGLSLNTFIALIVDTITYILGKTPTCKFNHVGYITPWDPEPFTAVDRIKCGPQLGLVAT